MFFLWRLHLAWPSHPGHSTILLQSESSSDKCAKLHTVASSNNRDHMPWSLCYCLFAPHIYGCYSSCISCSWWISHSTQCQRRGCDKSMTLIPKHPCWKYDPCHSLMIKFLTTSLNHWDFSSIWLLETVLLDYITVNKSFICVCHGFGLWLGKEHVSLFTQIDSCSLTLCVKCCSASHLFYYSYYTVVRQS